MSWCRCFVTFYLLLLLLCSLEPDVSVLSPKLGGSRQGPQPAVESLYASGGLVEKAELAWACTHSGPRMGPEAGFPEDSDPPSEARKGPQAPPSPLSPTHGPAGCGF